MVAEKLSLSQKNLACRHRLRHHARQNDLGQNDYGFVGLIGFIGLVELVASEKWQNSEEKVQRGKGTEWKGD